MAVNLTPLHDRVIVKRIEEKESVKGGIIIPDSAKEKPQEGEIIAVGAGKREKGERIPLDVNVGDRVLFGKYSGSEIKLEGGIPDSARGRNPRQAGRSCESGTEVKPDIGYQEPRIKPDFMVEAGFGFHEQILGGMKKWRSRLLPEKLPAKRSCVA